MAISFKVALHTVRNARFDVFGYVVLVNWERKEIRHNASSMMDAWEWIDCYPAGTRACIMQSGKRIAEQTGV